MRKEHARNMRFCCAVLKKIIYVVLYLGGNVPYFICELRIVGILRPDIIEPPAPFDLLHEV